MSVFTLCALGGTPVYTGWINMKPKARMESAPLITFHQLRMRISVVYLLLVPSVLKETRSSILFTRITRKTTGDHRYYRARVESEWSPDKPLKLLICTRPVRKLANRLINTAQPKCGGSIV